jgi:RNA polymerase sigma-70 factor (ECF subfamily)
VLVDRFADAFQAGDVDAIVALLTEDAWLTMPPVPLEYQGPEAIGGFLRTVPARGELWRFRLVATRANGQPAFGLYLSGRVVGILVLTLAGDRVSAVTAFHDTSVLARFGLPRAVPHQQAVQLEQPE